MFNNNVITTKRAVADVCIPFEEQLRRSANSQESKNIIEKMKKEVYDRGYKAGVAAGAAKQQHEIDNQFGELISSIPQVIKKALKEVEEEVVKLCLNVAQKVIRKEIENKQYIMQTISALLQSISDKTELTLKLNPRDMNNLREAGMDLGIAKDVKELKIVEDDSIAQGGCIIKTNLGWLDATIDTQMAEIEKHLLPEGDKTDTQVT